jgi:penicillin amidase
MPLASKVMARRLIPAVLGLCLCHAAVSAAPPPEYGHVELLRDTWNIPHVFGDTDAGAMYGVGYACAEERGFQMHYALRIIQGRLAEVVGERRSAARPKETALDNDRKMRTFGFYRAAKEAANNLDAGTRGLLDAYCAGVNDYFSAHADRLHPLFRQLDLKPEPWTPADCVASWWHLGQFFAGDGTRELLHYRNLQAGRVRGFEPTPLWSDESAAVVGREDVSAEWLDRVNRFARERETKINAPPASDGPKFSHAWVVGGRKTSTGAAVLVSDPQTPVRNPSLWHEFHVRGKTFNARGIGVPGSPGLLVGWNEHVAWGATALGADQADLFRLQTDAQHPDQYLFDGRWRDMEVSREVIRVKGAAAAELPVRRTHLGPVVTPFAFPAAGDPEVALRRVPVCQTDRETIQALFGMMRARSVDDFGRAVGRWQFPSANLIAGDSQGNIGYWLAAAVPVRSSLDVQRGTAAVDGTSSRWEWQGFVPPDLRPHVINPARGWIASANHRAVGSFYPLPLGLSTGGTGHTVRSWRLYERLAARERFAPKDVLDLHFDAVNPARRDIVRLALHAHATPGTQFSPEAGKALKLLGPWFERGASSDLSDPAAVLACEINTFFRLVNTPLAAKYGGGESGLTRFLRDRTQRIGETQLSDDEVAYVDAALAGAWTSATQKYGDDRAAWTAPAREQAGRTPIGYFDSLDGFGSLDPRHDLTPPALACTDGGTIRSQAAQSYTQFVPLDDVDAALSLLPPGHGERPDDPSRITTMALWGSGQLHAAPLSREAVGRIATSRSRLDAPGVLRPPAASQ